jgi:hypothetical protein
VCLGCEPFEERHTGEALSRFFDKITEAANIRHKVHVYKILCVCLLAIWEPSQINKPAAQAADQTLPDATPPVNKIHPFSKIAVSFETICQFSCPLRFRISHKMSI